MRIAVISDIHANLPALEEVLKALRSQNVDAVYCLGDVVNQNVWNNEVITLLKENNIFVIKGNHDAGIGADKRNFEFSFSSRDTEKSGKEAIEYTLQQVTPENKAILNSYHLEKKLVYHSKDGQSLKLLLTHGVPGDFNQRLWRFLPKDRFAQIMQDADVDILLTGNTHSPHHIIIPVESEGETIYKHAINPGAIGKTNDGDWRSSYAIITFHPEKDLHKEKEAVQVDFYRLEYDLDRAVKAIQNSPLSILYAGFLIGGQ
ncbi:MAG: metallophosphoesterase family protein [Ginsengibacter sp.]